MTYQARNNCVFWSANAASTLSPNSVNPFTMSVSRRATMFVDQRTYKLKNSYRTDPSPLEVILGTALVVKNSPLPVEYVRVLVELQDPVTARQYHCDRLKLCHEDPYYSFEYSDIVIELLNDRCQFVTKPLLIECPVLSRTDPVPSAHVIECQTIQKKKKMLSDIMTCWRNLFQHGTRPAGTGTDEEKRMELAFIPTQVQRFDQEHFDHDDDYDLDQIYFYDPHDLYLH